MDLRRLIAILRPWLPLLVVSVLLAGGVAFLISSILPKTYEAKASLIVGQSLSAANPDYNQLLVSQRLSSTYASVATKRPILEAVIADLHLADTPITLAERVEADAPLDSTLLTITARDGDPATAAAIANAMAAQLIEESPAIQGQQVDIQSTVDTERKATQAQIASTQAQIDVLTAIDERDAKQEADLQALTGRLVNLRATLATLLSFSSDNATNLLTIIEPAEAPLDAVAPNRFQNTFLGAVLGILLVGLIIFVAEYLYDGVRDPDDVRETTGLSTIGTIARMKGDRGRSEMYRLAALLYPRSSVAEAYRTLRTNIEFSSVDSAITTLLVTSSVTGEGKTVTAANLAVVYAQAGRRVLLVDADMRKPGVHTMFDLPNDRGLTTLLRRESTSLDAVAQQTEQENLRVLTSGPLPPNPSELIGSQRMRSVVELLVKSEKLVIFDSPPVQAVTDAAILGSFVDATLLVVDAQRSRRRVIRLARESLGKTGANVVGVVLNRIPARARADDQGAYGDYYGSTERAGRAPDPSRGLPGSPS